MKEKTEKGTQTCRAPLRWAGKGSLTQLGDVETADGLRGTLSQGAGMRNTKRKGELGESGQWK